MRRSISPKSSQILFMIRNHRSCINSRRGGTTGIGKKDDNCIKHKPLLQLGQDTISWGLLPQPENMDTGGFSTTPLSTIPRGSVVFLFALPSS